MLISFEFSLKQIAFSHSLSLLPVHLQSNEVQIWWRGRFACSVRFLYFHVAASEEEDAGVFPAAFPIGSVESGSLRLPQQTKKYWCAVLIIFFADPNVI